jgi:pectate lyase
VFIKHFCKQCGILSIVVFHIKRYAVAEALLADLGVVCEIPANHPNILALEIKPGRLCLLALSGERLMALLRLLVIVPLTLFLLFALPIAKLAASTPSASASVPAFPGAQGFGAESIGGRGGQVIEVTNLDDAGPGSLRACIEASGPRICVFRVGGTITVDSEMEISNPYITIAGQTAPGDGITLKASDNSVGSPIHVRTHDVIIRFLRFRPGTTGLNNRALSIGNQRDAPYNVMIDHNSFSWSGDELVIVWYDTQKVSLQWNIIAESLPSTDESMGLKGPNLGSDGGGNYSVHHNLIAHHLQRSPNISASGGPVDVVNNVIYNAGGIGARVHNGAQVNFVGNFVKAGPNTRMDSYIKDDGASGFYLDANTIEGGETIKRFLPDASMPLVVIQPFAAPAVRTTSAHVAYDEVLKSAGASRGLKCDGSWYERRDPVDERILESVVTNTRGHNVSTETGYINLPSDVGGWPDLDSGAPCPDADHDGMPDEWEKARGLNPNQDDSAGDRDGDGYTNIEEFINGVTASDPSQEPPPNPPHHSSIFLPLVTR